MKTLLPVETVDSGSAAASSSKGKEKRSSVAYVANILTIPSDNGIQPIIDAYAHNGMTKQFYSHFAMVIGVNRYQSLSGTTIERLERAVGTAITAPFPAAIVPFMWDFEWKMGFEAAQQAFRTLRASEQEKALQYERAQLVQSTIPYGSLREFVTAHERTRTFVETLASTHNKVYIHLGDDDASSLMTKLGPLLEGYAGLEASQRGAPLIVGGYEFRTREEGGDLSAEMPEELITALGSHVEIWFREVLSSVNADVVYPTEPNLAFLAADEGDPSPYELLLTASGQDSKRLEVEEKQERSKVRDVAAPDLYFTKGLVYGRNANEGAKLRERIGKVGGGGATPKAKPTAKGGRSKKPAAVSVPGALTTYEPKLAIATASTRFTIRDAERIQHDPTAGKYGVRREDAYSKGGSPEEKIKAYKRQVLEDVLRVKQSHISGLTKELINHPAYKRHAKTIGPEVFNAVVALLSGEKHPGKTSKEAQPFLDAIEKGKMGIAAYKEQLNEVISAMAARYEESLKKETPQATASTPSGDVASSDDSKQGQDLVTTSS